VKDWAGRNQVVCAVDAAVQPRVKSSSVCAATLRCGLLSQGVQHVEWDPVADLRAVEWSEGRGCWESGGVRCGLCYQVYCMVPSVAQTSYRLALAKVAGLGLVDFTA
jgi:hypothetical protein